METKTRFRIFAGILIFFAFLVVTAKIIDPDFYWHLQDGETILATHVVPRVDTYSYPMANIPWVDHEWLVEAWMAWMWNYDLAWALAIIFAVAAFIPFVVWLKRYRTWPDLWAIAAGAALFVSFLAVRPQVLSYLFFFIVFELLSRYYGDGKNRGARKKIYLAVLPLIFFVWANIHAEFFSGLVLFGIFFLTDTAIAWWREKKISWGGIPFAFTMLAASVITPLFNPYGAGLYGEIFRVMFSGNTMKYIQEWQSPFSMQATFSPTTIAISFLFSVFILLVIKYYKRLTPTALAAGLIFFLLFIKAMRMGPLFVIIAIPLICEGFVYASAEFSAHWHLVSRRMKIFFKGIGLVVSVAALCLVFFAPITLAATQYPASAVAFLNQSAAQGNHIVLLNYYSWGGYLIWNVPEIKVFIDGRMPHWIAPDGTSAMKDYITLFLAKPDPAAQEAIIKKWGINTMLIPSSDAAANNNDIALIKELQSEGWTATYKDSIAIILQCDTNSCDVR
jgi:hypothetical protein